MSEIRSISELTGRHPGETLTAVTVGPSVSNLSAEHIVGPVIAVYDAIRFVEALGLPNATYALQKDGCGQDNRPCPDCSQARGGMMAPVEAPLLLHLHESAAFGCFPDHSDRYVFDAVVDLGLESRSMPTVSCIPGLARIMGATALRLVSFDACTLGDWRRIMVMREEVVVISHAPSEADYAGNCQFLRREIGEMPTEWITPKDLREGQ